MARATPRTGDQTESRSAFAAACRRSLTSASSRASHCGESAAAARTLAVVLRDADDAPALARLVARRWTYGRRSGRPPIGWRDSCVGASPGAREPSWGLSADRRRVRGSRLDRLRDPTCAGSCARRSSALPASEPHSRGVRSAGTGEEHARCRFLHHRDRLLAAAVRPVLRRA
jgi:hypothetical protein